MIRRMRAWIPLVVLVVIGYSNAQTLTCSTKEVKAGTAAEIICVLSSSASGNMAWTKANGQAVSGATPSYSNRVNNVMTSTLAITAGATGSEESYKCTASDVSTPVTISTKLFSMTSGTNSARQFLVGSVAVLSCETSGMVATSTSFKWVNNGQTYTTADSSGDYKVVRVSAGKSTLTIAGTSVASDSTFSCYILVEGAWYDQTVMLYTYTSAMTSKQTMIGQKATLTCTFSGLSLSPSNDVKWSFGASSTKYSAGTVTNYKVTNTGPTGATDAKVVTSEFEVDASQFKDDTSVKCFYTNQGGESTTSGALEIFSVVTTMKEVEKGSVAAITCTTTGLGLNPGYSVKWTVGSKDYTTTDSTAGYTITNTVTSVASVSVLTVASSNTATDVTVQCKVTVDSNVNAVNGYIKTFSMAASTKEVKVGSNTALTCIISGLTVTSTNIKWKKGSSEYTQADNADNTDYQVSPDSINGGTQEPTLTLGAGATTADITFTCMVEVDGAWFSENIPLKTFTQVITPAGNEIKKSTQGVFTCTVTGLTVGSSSVKWTIGSTDYVQGAPANTAGYTISTGAIAGGTQISSITIKASNLAANLNIACKSLVDTAWFSEPKALLVYDVTATSAEVKNGTNTKLTCTVTYASSVPTSISWIVPESGTFTKDTADKLNFVVVDTETGYRTIKSVIETKDPQKDKDYVCAVNMNGLVSTATGSLNIFEIRVGDNAVKAGESITLACLIVGASATKSAADLTWKNSVGTIITQGSSFVSGSQRGELILNNIQEDAVYSCNVKMENVWYSRSALVDVFSVEVVNDVVMSGVDATPHCHVYNLTLPIAYFKWYDSNSQQITTGLSKSGAMGKDNDKLTITVTQDTTYKCTVNVLTYVTTKTWSSNVQVDFVAITHANVIALDTTQALLTCSLTGATRSYDSYSWTKPGTTATNEFSTNGVTINNGASYKLIATVPSSNFAKNQGNWACNYDFIRSTSMNMKRTLTKALSFDIAKWSVTPTVQYVQIGQIATYVCKGASTTSLSINPVYIWKVNGVVPAASDITTVNTNSQLVFNATADLDGKVVSCNAKWTSVAAVELTATAIIYSKNVHVFPTTGSSASNTIQVVAAKGEELVVTCVYSSLHKPGTVNWKKGTTSITGRPDYEMAKVANSSDSKTETYTLKFKNPQASNVATYTCEYDFGGNGNNWIGTINITKIIEISSFVQKNSPVISGYSGIFVATVTTDSSFSSIAYKFMRGSSVLSTKTQTGLTAEESTGQMIYRTDKDTLFDVEITWTGSYQTLKTNVTSKPKLNMLDSCKVTHTNINSITSLNNTDDYVVDNKIIAASCSKGYIMPSSSFFYVKTCSVDTTITFSTCTGGCWVPDLSSTVYTYYDFKDMSTLVGAGYTTTHYNTDVELTCSKNYTLKKAWNKVERCNSNAASELDFDGTCVVGCYWTKNSNTDFTYMVHKKNLIATTDSVTYNCKTNTMTEDGSPNFTINCTASVTGVSLALTECDAFVMAKVKFSARSNSVKLTFTNPTHPSTATPKKIVVKLLHLNGEWTGNSRTVNADKQVAFFDLKTSTTYKIRYMVIYENGAKYTSDGADSFSTTSPVSQPTGDAKVKNTLTIDVPQVDFSITSYGVLVVYKADEYIGDISNMKFVSVKTYNYNKEDKKKKRAVEVTVWVYPSSKSLYDSGAKLGAFYSDSILLTSINSNPSYAYKYDKIDMKRSAKYYFILRGCQDITNTTCADGNSSEVDMATNYDGAILLVFFLSVFILLLFVLLIYLFIHFNVWGRNGDKHKHSDSMVVKNPQYGY